MFSTDSLLSDYTNLNSKNSTNLSKNMKNSSGSSCSTLEQKPTLESPQDSPHSSPSPHHPQNISPLHYSPPPYNSSPPHHSYDSLPPPHHSSPPAPHQPHNSPSPHHNPHHPPQPSFLIPNETTHLQQLQQYHLMLQCQGTRVTLL